MKGHLFEPGEAVTFYLLDADKRGLPHRGGTVVVDPGGLRVTVRAKDDGREFDVPAGHAWVEA